MYWFFDIYRMPFLPFYELAIGVFNDLDGFACNRPGAARKKTPTNRYSSKQIFDENRILSWNGLKNYSPPHSKEDLKGIWGCLSLFTISCIVIIQLLYSYYTVTIHIHYPYSRLVKTLCNHLHFRCFYFSTPDLYSNSRAEELMASNTLKYFFTVFDIDIDCSHTSRSWISVHLPISNQCFLFQTLHPTG